MKKVILIGLMALGSLMAADDLGKTTYDKQCLSCHGKAGDLKALGKSAPIAGMKKEDLEKVLADYKDGKANKYGLGGLMKGNMAKLSEDETKAVVKYVSGMKAKTEEKSK